MLRAVFLGRSETLPPVSKHSRERERERECVCLLRDRTFARGSGYRASQVARAAARSAVEMEALTATAASRELQGTSISIW